MTFTTETDAAAAPAPRDHVKDLPLYTSATVGAVPIVFRASSNESPFSPSDAVTEAVSAAIAGGNRYPALHGETLVVALAEHMGVDASTVAVGDGSLSLLNHLLLAYVRPDHDVVHAWRSYEAYPISIGAVGARSVGITNLANHQHDLVSIANAVGDDTDAVILCSPNNPTGAVLSAKNLVDFLDRVPSRVIVVLDEAYREFVDPSSPGSFDAVPLLRQYPNLVLLRTFSKVYSLAGFRAGYMIASPEIVAATRAVMTPFPVSSPAVAAAIASLEEHTYRAEIIEKVTTSREEVATALRVLGLPVASAHGNFIWLPVGAQAEELANLCAASGIAVRCFTGEGVRVSVGQSGLARALSTALAGFVYTPPGTPQT
ncbi:aminotransferase class I/II-fold pyridoxal phosphate-dependent enzyme [Glaciihabitans sp. dw_435]|uniref:aminotransferase class I/II-fold pyridoxal phosphate-dependent enzyme n=1 Tax=Glaciihabitans sp. dw_435 TaxID=2720081 RepID=UPI001BD25ED9|nr:aminotransferase class I/II-fold pyridoxal phosphate-dependent enzyme [Glaciihabitans sp. dw_435]